jgi:hypothetical protein
VAFQHFRSAAHRGRELFENVRRRLVERDFDEHEQRQVEQMRIELRAEAGDVAVLLQALQPLAGRGRRQSDPLRKLDPGKPPIRL